MRAALVNCLGNLFDTGQQINDVLLRWTWCFGEVTNIPNICQTLNESPLRKSMTPPYGWRNGESARSRCTERHRSKPSFAPLREVFDLLAQIVARQPGRVLPRAPQSPCFSCGRSAPVPRYRGWSDRALPVNASHLLSHCWLAIPRSSAIPGTSPAASPARPNKSASRSRAAPIDKPPSEAHPGGCRLAYATPAAPEPFICQSANFGSTFDRTGKLGNQSNFRPDL